MKCKQIIGLLIYKAFAQYLPKSSSHLKIFQTPIRRICGRMILAKCGENVNIERKANFSCRVTLGNNSGIGINANLQGGVDIGNDVMMGPNCTIYTQNHRFDQLDIPMIKQGFYEEEKVTIEDDVWIGGNVTILPGVVIGKGAVVGASTVVTKSVPEYSVFVGNPGRVVKYRTDLK